LTGDFGESGAVEEYGSPAALAEKGTASTITASDIQSKIFI
jgi:hypothetical protein